MLDTNSKIGFIGQGWIGKNYADDFERRGFKTVRYSLDKNYLPNKPTSLLPPFNMPPNFPPTDSPAKSLSELCTS